MLNFVTQMAQYETKTTKNTTPGIVSPRGDLNLPKCSTSTREELGQLSTNQRFWLLKHKKPVDFELEELKKLRSYFDQLDSDGSGEIGLNELEIPLIALKICQTREEVEKVMN